MAVGRNIIDSFEAAVTVGGTTAPVLITVDDIPSDADYVSYESQLQSGDSGGPMFINSGGELLLTGINWAIGNKDIKPGSQVELRDISIYSYLGNYNTEIELYIVANQVSEVPEPSTMLSFLMGVGLLFFRRRR